MFECHVLSLHSHKRQKIDHTQPASPIVFGLLIDNKQQQIPLRILLDSGSSASILFECQRFDIQVESSNTTEWNTSAGVFSTNNEAQIQFKLPEFNETAIIETKVHSTREKARYNVIVG